MVPHPLRQVMLENPQKLDKTLRRNDPIPGASGRWNTLPSKGMNCGDKHYPASPCAPCLA